MDKFNFDEKLNTLLRNDIFFRRVIGGLIIANIISLIIAFSSINREKIVLVPQTAPEDKMWIKHSIVSSDYLNILSRNVMDLLLNVTPNNVTAQHKELLKMVSPSFYQSLELKLNDIDNNIKQGNISQNFYINSIYIVKNSNIVYVKGTLNEYIDQNLSHSVTRIYRLSFKVQNYYTTLTNFELLADNDPQLKDLSNAKSN